MIRTLIVDDEMLIRQGIHRLLELAPSIEVCGEARDGEEALQLIEATRPDVVLLDVRMPRMNGIELLRKLDGPGCIVLTTFDDADVVLDAIRAGARGYLLKDVSLEQLVHAIEVVAKGESLFQPAITERLLRGIRAVPMRLADPLTAREREVIRLMAGGYSNKEIAGALETAEGTVKNHVSSILSKLGVRDRTRAVLKALEGGLL
ncbi:MAG TPA: response regulator transcription factor [Thermoanaerobaculia bacterium]|jgi:DNA-binding NarL/FixJ family response regulator|nr:response regulator transcription factor [Thermoanaerobaculia bacterium]